MREENIEKMNFKELRAEVQLLRDELAMMKRSYEDILYNLDYENFSSGIVKEKDDMKAEIKVTAEEISTKVSKTDFESGIKQTAESISSYVTKINNLSSAVEAKTKDDFKDTDKTYVIRTYDENGNVTEETYYYYNTVSEKWEVLSGEYLYTLFEQTEDGFKLKGNVKVDGSCILTSSLTFDSSDNPLQIEYSADGVNNWHLTFNSGADKFMRLKIGANWSDPMKVVGDDGQDGAPGGSANVDAETIFNLLTNNGTEQGLFPVFYDGGGKLFINATFIRTGKLSSDRIDTDTLSCTRLYAKGYTSGWYAKMSSNVGDFGVYNSSASSNADPNSDDCIWGIYHSDPISEVVNFYSYGNNYMGYNNSQGKLYPKGVWDFTACDDVIGLDAYVSGGGSGTVVAVFG